MSPFSNAPERLPVERELGPDETLVWFGQPDSDRLRQRAWPTFWGTIPFGLFFLVWMSGTGMRQILAAGRWPNTGEILAPLFGLFMLWPLISGLIAPWRQAAQAKRTFYAITNRRALIVVEGRRRFVRTILPHELSLERHDLPNGRGDLVLKQEINGKGEDAKTVDVGFWGIANALEVERLLRDTLQRAD